jgi:hypothetical protein
MLTGYEQNKQCFCKSRTHILNCGLNIEKGDIFNDQVTSYGIKSKNLIDYRPTACIKYEENKNDHDDENYITQEITKQQQQQQQQGIRKNRHYNKNGLHLLFLFSYNNDSNNYNNLHKIKSFEPIIMTTPIEYIRTHDQNNNNYDNHYPRASYNYIMSVNKLNYHPSSSFINNNVGIQNARVISKKGNLLIGMIRYCYLIDDDDQDMSVLIRQIQDEAVCLYTFGVKFIILIRIDTILCTINESSLSSPLLLSSSSSSHQKLQQKPYKLLLSSLNGYIDLFMIYQNKNDDQYDLMYYHKPSLQQTNSINNNNSIPVISIKSKNDKILFSLRRSIHGILHIRYLNLNHTLALFD